ncbi:ArsR/SmtB family transcription factor [Streptomyces sp. NPDC059786]|uniref:ArsR/SmtB family transcription factor n=1 Tax=Streptomyces sp. NPDC059786 TaxID=3346946 RepID=UPI0036635626
MLQVHLTPDDIARVRIAAAPDPLWEIANGFHALTADDDRSAFGTWRGLVRPRLGPTDRLLAGLLPSRGYFPDFLTPTASAPHSARTLPSALDAVLGTPRSALRTDLARLAASPLRRRPLPDIARALAAGDTPALHRLGTALHSFYQRAVLPFWPQIRAQVDADRAARARTALAGGTDGLLMSFQPVLHWRPPVLVADYPTDRVLRLDGRGLVLQPSFFCRHRPLMLVDLAADRIPVLVYPIQHSPGWPRPDAGPQRGTELTALLGRMRAAILADAVTGRTTGELAERLGISSAAVSQHTAILRRAGLLLSVRHHKYVVHTITTTGLVLLGGAEASV